MINTQTASKSGSILSNTAKLVHEVSKRKLTDINYSKDYATGNLISLEHNFYHIISPYF